MPDACVFPEPVPAVPLSPQTWVSTFSAHSVIATSTERKDGRGTSTAGDTTHSLRSTPVVAGVGKSTSSPAQISPTPNPRSARYSLEIVLSRSGRTSTVQRLFPGSRRIGPHAPVARVRCARTRSPGITTAPTWEDVRTVIRPVSGWSVTGKLNRLR
ncbi:CRISPR-associated DxTHG motif protein [Nocardia panacis]|uniref:CRISPR-associated DxTHG motif protein n=1 Tax=Nocardia panacis TaxID=2340916 RepID=A0A3A4KZB4_9NOCA|nr:CRISPR-associated DxTHG motif protein [Nocardia panacis]